MGKMLSALALAGLGLVLSGCAQQMFAGAQKDCSAFGFAQGSAEYANCVQLQYNSRAMRFQTAAARLQQAGANIQQQNNAALSSPSAPVAPMTRGRLVNETVSGQSRLCQYNNMGSPYVVTVSRNDLCPY